MKRRELVIVVTSICLVLVAGFPCQAEDLYGCAKKINGQLRLVSDPGECLKSENVVLLRGQLDPKCMDASDLINTKWSGTIKGVAGPGFWENVLQIVFIESDGDLFTAQGKMGSLEIPLYGAILRCNQIRIATGETVLFATLNPSGGILDGYAFSTDPLKSLDGSWDLSQPNPGMMTFRLSLQEE